MSEFQVRPIEPDTDETKQISEWLRQFNLQTNSEFMTRWMDESNPVEIPLNLVVEIDDELVGGLLGVTLFSWLKVSILVVKQEHRQQGFGKDLMLEAERIAIERGCTKAYVDSMQYQAPEFYQKLGYEIVGKLSDWDSHGHSKFFFEKHLVKSPLPRLCQSFAVVRVRDTEQAEHFYQQLGFTRSFAYFPVEGQRNPGYIGVTRDGVTLHLSSHSGDGTFGSIAYVQVENLDALHQEYKANDVSIDLEPTDQTWGNREMYVKDSDGNCLRFVQGLS